METSPQAITDQIKVCRPSWQMRLWSTVLAGWLLLIFFSGISRPLLFVSQQPLPGAFFYLCLLGIVPSLCALIAGCLLLFAYTPRLILSPQGVMYEEPGYRLSARWQDVSRVHEVRLNLWSRWGSYEVLILNQASLHAPTWIAALLRLTSVAHRVPLSPFNNQWRTAEIGAYLQRYAPQVNLSERLD